MGKIWGGVKRSTIQSKSIIHIGKKKKREIQEHSRKERNLANNNAKEKGNKHEEETWQKQKL